MVISQEKLIKPTARLTVTWEKLPIDYKLEEEPVENTGQPLIAGALREALEMIGFIKPEMLMASNLGICATVNQELVIKAPDWLYVASVEPLIVPGERKSYTPNLEGDTPSIVMEFLSDTDGGEYSFKRTSPVGKWFFYEQILKVPTYIIFEPASGLLEVYRWREGRYELELPDSEGRHWFAEMGLFLGTWRGEKEGRTGYWLRWWNEEENLLLWGVELLEKERQRSDKLVAYLLSQGINPDEIDLS
ncbi:Uma2 family endonuclease [Limnofasciculus baicalensis]|uniref:Uma2 family endonuclease n=1 Tax=Limnofasciculus baicalensis BBK-W-15 TaxID=2699891 RepID=A0AAE3GWE0_9CYAN|nr:Uma2 family endonuclease [Limnofasciculus baicalensis]MCP2731719.1 Uma2 family endonuclease [Limnofasciculus baicalensis BBK-W-15]